MVKPNAKQTHNENDRTLRGEENLFTNNNLRLTLNDRPTMLDTLSN